MISIGAKFGGPELCKSRIRDWLDRIASAVRLERRHFEIGIVPSVHVVYCVSGSQVRYDFDAMRESEFSQSDMRLTVEVALPDEVVIEQNPTKFLVDWLRGANAIAFEFYRQRGIDYELAEAEEMVDGVKRRMA